MAEQNAEQVATAAAEAALEHSRIKKIRLHTELIAGDAAAEIEYGIQGGDRIRAYERNVQPDLVTHTRLVWHGPWRPVHAEADQAADDFAAYIEGELAAEASKVFREPRRGGHHG